MLRVHIVISDFIPRTDLTALLSNPPTENSTADRRHTFMVRIHNYVGFNKRTEDMSVHWSRVWCHMFIFEHLQQSRAGNPTIIYYISCANDVIIQTLN